ncbi:hypothetical protein Mgra_00003203, partial [Meloidogyne graminicola]
LLDYLQRFLKIRLVFLLDYKIMNCDIYCYNGESLI